jgi:hypothetical protein
MAERSFEERSRVSAPVLRTFLNIADRWKLSLSERLALLQCDGRQFEEWSSTARFEQAARARNCRAHAALGDPGRFRGTPPISCGSADRERDWLTRPHKAAPFAGRAPLDLLRGTFEDQIAVRRYAYGIGLGVAAPNEIDRDFTPYTDEDLIWDDATPQIRAVCFDGFGTLVEIGDKRRPFKALLGDFLHRPGRDQGADHSDQPAGPRSPPCLPLDETRLTQLEADLEAECARRGCGRGLRYRLGDAASSRIEGRCLLQPGHAV